MALPQKMTYPIEDIYSLPEGTIAGLMDGKICYMTPPSRTHQRILDFINTEINLFIRSNKGSCEVYPSPFCGIP